VGDLTKNFSWREFRCPCCGVAIVAERLAKGLQELRDLTGRPIYITVAGGYRCPSRNVIAGGKPDSQHLLGKAADCVIEGLSVREMAEAAGAVEVFRDGGIGVYPADGFVHLDVRGWRARWGQRVTVVTEDDEEVTEDE